VTEQISSESESANRPLASREQILLARNPDWKLGETQKGLTGYVGLAVLILCAVTLVLAGEDPNIESNPFWAVRYLIVVALIFAAMAMMEIVVFKVHKRNFDFSAARQASSTPKNPVRDTLLGFYACLLMVGVLLAAANLVFPEFIIFYLVFGLTMGVVAPVYFTLAQKYIRDDAPINELQLFGAWLTSIVSRSKMEGTMSPAERGEHLANLMRGVFIKAFFIPYMTISCISMWNLFSQAAHHALHANPFAPLGTIESAQGLHVVFLTVIHLIVIVDTTIALLGYLTSSRFLDTQFTTAEPTPLGWASAMICYPPFNYFFEKITIVLTYQLSWPVPMFQEHPQLAIGASTAIVILMSIYSWATVMFGLRFSNLTNRGIICSGPYRVIRHPAYAAKNTAWWIAFAPAIIMLGSVALIPAVVLLVLNSTYVLRALTEERHLMREEHYVEYCKRVKWKFIPGIW
jgi:Putative protein-S-isoprenylcysteine methyltransferase